MEEESKHFVDLTTNAQDVLATLGSTPILFKNLTNFTTTEFADLASIVVPIIISHARSIGETPIVSRRPSKLSLEQHLFNFVFLFKHYNFTKYDFHVEMAKSLVCTNDVLFISSYIDLHLWIKYVGLQPRRELHKGPIYKSCHNASNSLMGNLGEIQVTGLGSMVAKKSML
jgi:hypothetical protein